jgi:acetyltransferase-like isoleucine patch superfamily enzyme
MTNASNIHIGKGCLIQDRVYLRAGMTGEITIGNGAALNSFVQIYGHGGIEIGDDTQVGPNTVLTTTGHDYLAANLQQNYESIKIGRRVWISANCTILPGVTIGDQAVIGAGAVVSRNIPARCVALGIPARVVRHFNDESDAMEHDSAVPHARAENQ